MSYKELIKELLEELKERSLNCFGDRLYSLVVFGSVASGLNTPESDVDVIYILKNFRGSYEEFSLYYSCVEENLKTLKDLKKLRINTFISPIFLDINHLTVRMPIFWKTEFIVLYDKGVFRKFLSDLKKFKREKLIYHDKPMPYFEVLP